MTLVQVAVKWITHFLDYRFPNARRCGGGHFAASEVPGRGARDIATFFAEIVAGRMSWRRARPDERSNIAVIPLGLGIEQEPSNNAGSVRSACAPRDEQSRHFRPGADGPLTLAVCGSLAPINGRLTIGSPIAVLERAAAHGR
jgi:hypothetical protein